MKTSKSVTKLFVEDYQIQHGLVNENEKVNDEVGEKFSRSSFRLFSMFTFDFIMCQVIIGELSVKKRDQNLKSSSLMLLITKILLMTRTLCGLMLEECLGLVSTLAGGGALVRGCDQHQHCHHGHRSHHHRDH